MSAVIGGAATTISVMFVEPHLLEDFAKVWKIALASGIINAALYLKQSPLPPTKDGQQ
jgi:hypothetical protein